MVARRKADRRSNRIRDPQVQPGAHRDYGGSRSGLAAWDAFGAVRGECRLALAFGARAGRREAYGQEWRLLRTERVVPRAGPSTTRPRDERVGVHAVRAFCLLPSSPSGRGMAGGYGLPISPGTLADSVKRFVPLFEMVAEASEGRRRALAVPG